MISTKNTLNLLAFANAIKVEMTASNPNEIGAVILKVNP